MTAEVTAQPLVVMEKVNKHFGDLHVLRDIDLSVDKGEVVVVLGPSGSGKSTLCRTINRLEPIESGTITLDGVPLPDEGKQLAQLRSEVGMVFQSFNLFAHKTVLENVTLGPIKVLKKDKAAAEKRGRELLDRVGISAQADKYPAQLSGGQQQRVAIARALANRPKLLIADEPTGQLDSQTGRAIMQLIQALVRSQKVTAIVATHDPVLLNLADRVIELRDGTIVSDELTAVAA
jgi:glutamate transport system ATP-binding protein